MQEWPVHNEDDKEIRWSNLFLVHPTFQVIDISANKTDRYRFRHNRQAFYIVNL